MQKYYFLSQKPYLTTVFIKPKEGYVSDIFKEIKEGTCKFPISFYQQKDGKKWSDVLDTREAIYFFVVSDRLANVIKDNKFTGCKFFPVEIYNLKSELVTGYQVLYTTGRAGLIRYSDNIIEKRFVDDGPLVKVHKGLEITDWDGSDFFIPQGSAGVIVTERVKKELSKHKFTNLMFSDISQIEITDSQVRLVHEKRKSGEGLMYIN